MVTTEKVFHLTPIDFANHIFFWQVFYLSKEIIKRSSKVIGEIRARDIEWRWPSDMILISGPEKIENFETLVFHKPDLSYVDPGECRQIAEKLYAAEMRFKSREKLRFMKMADIFSFGSIMNGVGIWI